MKKGWSIFWVLFLLVSFPAFGQENEIKMLSNETAFWMVKSGSVSKVAVVDFLDLQGSLLEIPQGEKRGSSVKKEEDTGRCNDVPTRSDLFNFQPWNLYI